MKWKIKRKKIPKSFTDSYENSEVYFIDKENFESFIV